MHGKLPSKDKKQLTKWAPSGVDEEQSGMVEREKQGRPSRLTGTGVEFMVDEEALRT